MNQWPAPIRSLTEMGCAPTACCRGGNGQRRTEWIVHPADWLGSVQLMQPTHESAFDLVAEGFIQHAATPQGRDGLRQIAFAIDADLGRPEIVIHHVVASDDLVCVHLDLVGTHVRSSFPLLNAVVPCGRKVTWSFLHLFRVVEGLVTEHWACRDDLGMLEQLGLDGDRT